MKEILTLAARSAINHDLKMKSYYQRKIKEGKSDRVVVNNVRNKLIHIMFAVVRNKIPYNSLYEHPDETNSLNSIFSFPICPPKQMGSWKRKNAIKFN